jgi:hypothetical protein
MTTTRAWFIGLPLLAVLGAAHPALARPDSPPQLVIVSAKADTAAGTLTIDGAAFGDGRPVVTLNGMPLDVVTSTPSDIVASLPAGLDPGTYLLTVSRGPATTQFDSFNLTLGAAGPQGPPGATGATGAAGPQGPPGTFTGHFQSPNGQYSLDVTDTGIRLAGPGATIQLGNGTVTIMTMGTTTVRAQTLSVRSDLDTDIRAGQNLTLRADSNADIEASAAMTVKAGATTTIQAGAATDIRGNPIFLNGGTRPAARVNDPVQVDPASGTGVITSGSTSVFIGN